jgi:hypothetical protein
MKPEFKVLLSAIHNQLEMSVMQLSGGYVEPNKILNKVIDKNASAFQKIQRFIHLGDNQGINQVELTLAGDYSIINIKVTGKLSPEAAQAFSEQLESQLSSKEDDNLQEDLMLGLINSRICKGSNLFQGVKLGDTNRLARIASKMPDMRYLIDDPVEAMELYGSYLSGVGITHPFAILAAVSYQQHLKGMKFTLSDAGFPITTSDKHFNPKDLERLTYLNDLTLFVLIALQHPEDWAVVAATYLSPTIERAKNDNLVRIINAIAFAFPETLPFHVAADGSKPFESEKPLEAPMVKYENVWVIDL